MKTKILLLLLLPLLMVAACKKEKLTKETQEGANTFSCKINGKVYIAKSELFSKGLIGSITADKNGVKTLYIGSVMYHGDESGYAVFLTIPDFVGVGIYDLKDKLGSVSKTSSPTVDYSSKPNGFGTLNVKFLDIDKRIISGIFEFTAVDINDPNNTITITDGRFDRKF